MRWDLFHISQSKGIYHTINMAALLSATAARRNRPTQGRSETTAPRVAAGPAESPIPEERGDSASPQSGTTLPDPIPHH